MSRWVRRSSTTVSCVLQPQKAAVQVAKGARVVHTRTGEEEGTVEEEEGQEQKAQEEQEQELVIENEKRRKRKGAHSCSCRAAAAGMAAGGGAHRHHPDMPQSPVPAEA